MRSLDPKQVDGTLVNLVDVSGETSVVVQAARFRNLKAIDFPTGGRFNPAGILRLSGWVRRNGFDILHSHGYKSDIYSLLAARLCGKKAISTPHGWSKEEKDMKLKFYESLDRRCLRYMDHVCPLSPELWEDLKKCGVNGTKNSYIANGVDLEEVDHVVASDDKPGETIIIGYVGQLIERKNIPILFKVFQSVNAKRGNLQLWIVGDGPLGNNLRKVSERLGITDKVRFIGYCEDALSLMKTFDIFVLPSLLEGIPRCVMEAMALGIPVVASDIPGNRQLVEHMRTGLLFPLDEPDSLAESILFILDHPGEASEMCRRAREKVEKQFSAKRMAVEYTSVYQGLSCKQNHGFS